jgi:hypothetical protein
MKNLNTFFLLTLFALSTLLFAFSPSMIFAGFGVFGMIVSISVFIDMLCHIKNKKTLLKHLVN